MKCGWNWRCANLQKRLFHSPTSPPEVTMRKALTGRNHFINMGPKMWYMEIWTQSKDHVKSSQPPAWSTVPAHLLTISEKHKYCCKTLILGMVCYTALLWQELTNPMLKNKWLCYLAQLYTSTLFEHLLWTLNTTYYYFWSHIITWSLL